MRHRGFLTRTMIIYGVFYRPSPPLFPYPPHTLPLIPIELVSIRSAKVKPQVGDRIHQSKVLFGPVHH